MNANKACWEKREIIHVVWLGLLTTLGPEIIFKLIAISRIQKEYGNLS